MQTLYISKPQTKKQDAQISEVFPKKYNPLLSNKLFLWYNFKRISYLNNLKSLSKKIILLFLTFLALGGVSFLLLRQKREVPVVKTSAEIKVVKNPVEILDIDSDEDGLKDWEETLWKLDPKNSDTDGNGVSDAEEVKNKITEIDTSKSEDVAMGETGIENESSANDTETDIISKKLFAEYINLKQSGNFNEESVTATVNNLVADEIQNKKAVQYYFLKDIKTFPSGNKSLLKSYGDSFASIRNRYENQYLDNPLVKEGEVANLVDPKFQEGLIRFSDAYKKMAAELSKLSVPKDLAETHMEILNAYMASSDGLKELSMISSDPVMAMIGTQRHIEATEKESLFLETIAENFYDNGVVFSENEASDMWNNI